MTDKTEPAGTYDLIVVGSGAAGMAAALTAKIGGLEVAIFEKDRFFGGSTAVSGGAIWVPNNPLMRAAGMEDDAEAALEYLSGEIGNLIDRDLVHAFIDAGPEMVNFFQDNTELKFECRAFSPDYHPDRPGAAMGGRVLDPETFDGRRLGEDFKRLKPPIGDFTLFGGMMLNRFDIGHFMNMTRKPASTLHAARLLARQARDRLSHPRGTRLTLGQAVAGRLALSAIQRDIPIFTDMALDRAKPGVIAVSPAGRRFVNEALSYHDFVSGMNDANLSEAWLICDHRAMRRYGLGPVRPAPAPYRHHLRSGYLKKADTPAGLATLLGVPVQALAETITRFNIEAATGKDKEFGKGSTVYQTCLGDAENKPNPCLRPLDKPPYYAIRIHPGDIGTSMGLAVDRHACVLRKDRTVIEGLYACGNDMNSIMAGTYPGAGITLGPALTFGYIVGRHASAKPDPQGGHAFRVQSLTVRMM